MNDNKKEVLSFSFPEQVKLKLQKKAMRDHRSLSWYINNIFEKEIERITTKGGK